MRTYEPVGKFQYQDRYSLSGRGVVLTGILANGRVSSGMELKVSNGVILTIRGVQRMGVVEPGRPVGLLVSMESLTNVAVSLVVDTTYPIWSETLNDL